MGILSSALKVTKNINKVDDIPIEDLPVQPRKKTSNDLSDQVDKMLKEGKRLEQSFKKTRKAYKLFVKKDDKLYPLFVNAADEVPQGEFLEADFPDTAFKGKTLGGTEGFYVPTKGAKREKGEKVKKTGDTIIIPDEETRQKLIEAGFITKRAGRTEDAPYGKVTAVAARPGWHSSVNPVAEHLGPQDLKITKAEAKKLIQAGINPKAIRTRGDQYYVKRRAEDHVWAEVDMADDTSDELLEYMAQTGRTDINDKVPVGGSYSYVDGQADGDTWIVGGNMRVNRTLTREEARALQDELGVRDLPYRDEVEAILGRKFAEGGLVGEQNMYKGEQDYLTTASSRADMNQGETPMMEQQMSFFNEGGLKDEGGEVDPVSGNDVPIGSTKKEVRDDIPAMLSEGEFVFPADVVRFIGLEKLMKIRQNAKQGLKKMEEMGQMGNSDEATMPDDLPFGMMDLIIVEGEEEEPQKKAHGGVVHMQKGGFTVPKFDPRNQDVRPYENAEGKKLNIPFFDNKPLYPIPEGYFPVGTVVEEEKDETKEAIPTDDDPRDPSGAGQVTNAFTEAGSWEGSPLDMYIKEAEKVSTFGNVAAGVMAATVPVLGAFVSLANKNQKKRILATIDARIEEAKKTDVPGQVLALREVKDRLTKDERKGILGGIVGEIIDGIADGLGLSKAEKVTAKVTSSYNATVDPTEPDQNTTDTQQQILNELNNKGFTGEFSFGSLVPKSGEEILEAVKTLPLNMGLPTEPVPEFLTDQTEEVLFGDTPVGKGMPKAPTQMVRPEFIGEGLPKAPTQMVRPEFIGEGLPKAPTEILTDDDMGLPTKPVSEYPFAPTTATEDLKSILDDLRNLRGITDEIKENNTYAIEYSAPRIEQGKELLDKLTSSISEANLAGRNKGRSDDPQAGPAGSTAYEAGQQRKGSTPSSSNNDDDGPSLAERMQKTRQEADQKIKEVQAKAQDRGATQAEQDKIVSEGEKIKEKLEQQKKGIKTGFKKGGLASRKK